MAHQVWHWPTCLKPRGGEAVWVTRPRHRSRRPRSWTGDISLWVSSRFRPAWNGHDVPRPGVTRPVGQAPAAQKSAVHGTAKGYGERVIDPPARSVMAAYTPPPSHARRGECRNTRARRVSGSGWAYWTLAASFSACACSTAARSSLPSVNASPAPDAKNSSLVQ